MTLKFLWMMLPTELQSDSNWDVRTVTCLLHRQNGRWIYKQKYYVGNYIGNS